MTTPYLFIPTSRSGVAKYAAELSWALTEHSNDAPVLIAPHDYEFLDFLRFKAVPVVTIKPIAGRTILGVLSAMLRQILSVTYLIHLEQKKRSSVRLSIHLVSSYPPLLQLLFHCLLKAAGARILYTVHDVLPHHRVGRTRMVLKRIVQRWVYRTADDLHVHTLSQSAQLTDLRVNPRRTPYLIPHGVTPSHVSPECIERDPNKLLVLGAIRANKRILEAVQAVVNVGGEGWPVTLTIRGAPSKTERRYFDALTSAATRHAGSVIFLPGLVSEIEFDRELRAAGAILLPYRDFSSQSGVILRAVQQGCFPICSSVVAGDLPLGHMLGFTIQDPCEVPQIDAGIRHFMTLSSAQRHARVDALRSMIEETQSWVSVASKFSRWYESAK